MTDTLAPDTAAAETRSTAALGVAASPGTPSGDHRCGRRSPVPALVVTTAALAAFSIPAAIAGASAASAPPAGGAFPERIASYSWWTPALDPTTIDAAAMIYTNGFGVELGDVPQSVVSSAALSPDGRWIAAVSSGALLLVDATTGDLTELDGAVGSRGAVVGDDAWAPSGDRFVVATGDGLRLVDRDGAMTPVDVPLHPEHWVSAVGWRDDATLLTQVSYGSANTSELQWWDVETGATTTLASYAPDWTGASMAAPDTARDLVPTWTARAMPINQGGVPTALALLAAGIAGLIAFGLTKRRLR